MVDSQDVTLRLVGMVYDAALDEHKWPSFLDAFTRAVGGESAMLRSVDLQTNAAGFDVSVGYDPAWKAAYCNYFLKHNSLTGALHQFPAGDVNSSDGISKHGKTELCNDYSTHQDKLHAMGALLVKDDSHTLLFAAQRGKHAGAFGEEDVRLMNILVPHVTRAAHVHREIRTLTVEKEHALGALDQLRMGVILTNRCGQPLFFNRAAELMLAGNAGISIFHDRLALATSAETVLLYKLIFGASQSNHGAAARGDMRISLPQNEGYLHCLVTPASSELCARWNIAAETDYVALFLAMPGALKLSPQRLAVLYGLTPAEARLAAKLATFKSMEQVAGSLGVAIATARSHLKSVFTKTGTHSQSELLMLLASGTLANCCDK